MPGRTRIAEAEIVAKDRTSAGVKSAIGNFQELHSVVRDNWWGAQNLGTAFAGLGTIIAGGFAVAAKASIDFEAGIAGVARTTREVGETAEQAMADVSKLGGVADELRNIAITSPVDTGRLASIAEEAGALGVARGDIADFTGSIAKLVATTNLTDAAASQLARIGGVMNITAGATDNLGSAILFAGRSTAATESEIVRFAQYLAPVARQAGATTGELIAMSAVLPSLGQRADTARTAMSRAINLMGQAVRENGDDLKVWAGVADQSTQAFADGFNKNGFQALEKFISGLSRLNKEQMAVALDKTGLREGRQRNVMIALASAYDGTADSMLRMDNAMRTTQEQFDENIELTEAYKLVTGTTKAQIEILKNQVADLGLSLAGVLLPPLGWVIDKMQNFVYAIANMHPALRTGILIAAAFTTVLGLVGGALLLLGPRVILVVGAFKAFQTQYAHFATSAANSAAIMASAQNTGTVATLRSAAAYGRMTAAQREAAFAAFTAANNQKVANAVQGEAVLANNAMNRSTELGLVLKGQEARMTALLAGSMAAMGKVRQAELAAAAAMNRIKTLEIQQSAQLARAHSLEAAGRTALADRARASAAATGAQIAALQAQVRGHQQAAAAATAQARSLQAAAGAQGKLAASTKVQIAALNAQAAAHLKAAQAAGVDAAAMNVAAASTKRLTVAASFLGKALKKLMWPLLILMTVLPVAGNWMDDFGSGMKNANDAAEQGAKFQAGWAKALQDQRAGVQNATRDFTMMRLEMVNGIAIADRYGVEIAELMAIINGSASNAQVTSFDAKLLEGFNKGDKEVAAFYKELGQLSEAYQNSGASAKSAGSGVDANSEALKDNAEAAAKAKKAQDELRETNDAINQALLALPPALLAQREALLGLEDAQEAYNEALAAAADNTEEIADAEADLLKARRNQAKAMREIVKAEKDLTTARQRGYDDLADAQDSYMDAQDAIYDTNEKVAEAEAKLAELREGPTVENLTKATNALAAANLKLRKSQFSVRDAQYMLNYLMAEGASARDIEEAQFNLDEANQNVAESTQDVADATKELEDVRNPSPEAIEKAERELASARRDAAEASRNLRQAEDELSEVRQAVRNDQYYKDAEYELADAREKAADAARDVRDAESALNDARSGKQATRDLERAELDLEQALYQVAEANVEVQKQTALSRGEAFGLGREAKALSAELGRLGSAVGGQIGAEFGKFSGILAQARADIGKSKDEIDTLSDAFLDEAGELAGITLPTPAFSSDLDLGPQGEGASESFLSGMIKYFKENGPIAIATALIAVIVGAFAVMGLAAIGAPVWLAAAAVALVAGLVFWISKKENQEKVVKAIKGLFDWLKGIRDSMDAAGKKVEQAIIDWWKRYTQEMKDEVRAGIKALFNWLGGIKDSLTAAKDGAKKEMETWWNFIVEAAKAYFKRRFVEMFAIGTWLKEKLGLDEKGAKESSKGWGERIMGALISGLKFALTNFTIWGLIRNILVKEEPGGKTSSKGWGERLGTALKDGFLNMFGNFGILLRNVLATAFNSLPSVIKGPINYVISLWNWLISSLSGRGFSFGGSFGIPKVTVDLSWLKGWKLPALAEGGITRGPMAAIIGEAGQEAVVPLDELWRRFEPLFSMAEAMRDVGAMASATSGGNTYNTNVYVETDADPYEIGREILWNNMTRVH